MLDYHDDELHAYVLWRLEVFCTLDWRFFGGIIAVGASSAITFAPLRADGIRWRVILQNSRRMVLGEFEIILLAQWNK